jgi:hypothetical protein
MFSQLPPHYVSTPQPFLGKFDYQPVAVTVVYELDDESR